MSDFVSLVLGIPTTIEGIVKACRALDDYRNLEERHQAAVDRAEFGCRKLAYYVSFIATDAIRPHRRRVVDARQQQLVEEAIYHANDAMENVERVIAGWSVRLGGAEKSGRMFVASLADAISERMKKNKILLARAMRQGTTKVISQENTGSVSIKIIEF